MEDHTKGTQTSASITLEDEENNEWAESVASIKPEEEESDEWTQTMVTIRPEAEEEENEWTEPIVIIKPPEESNHEWSQSVVTVTPENVATIREFSDTTVLSGTENILLESDTVYGGTFSDQRYMTEMVIFDDKAEEEEAPLETQEAEEKLYISEFKSVQMSSRKKKVVEKSTYNEFDVPPEKQEGGEKATDTSELGFEISLEERGAEEEAPNITGDMFEVSEIENAENKAVNITRVMFEIPSKKQDAEKEAPSSSDFGHGIFLEEQDAGKEPSKKSSGKFQIFPEKQDAKNQTHLRGVPQVVVEYKDVGSQTLYMSSPCPPLEYYKDIMTLMKDGKMPKLKNTYGTNTICTFGPESTQHYVTKNLMVRLSMSEIIFEYKPADEKVEDTKMKARDILYFILERVFWIIDPSNIPLKVETKNVALQTNIWYNFRAKSIVIDSETQTGLTCNPKDSNTTLLVDYQKTKDMVKEVLEKCFSEGIESRVFVDNIVDEILDNCVERIRYPMKDQTIQTIATYSLDNEKEEEILRKLRLEVIVDPFEASIVVLPLMDHLLRQTCDIVGKNADDAAKSILNTVLHRTVTISTRLAEIRKESDPKKMDKVFEQRRKRMLEWTSKKPTESVATQTFIAGVPEVTRMKEPRLQCSVCRRPSLCQWCEVDEEEEEELLEAPKMLKTRDILLAYKPCYIISTPVESEKNLHLQPACPTEKEKIKKEDQRIHPTCLCSDSAEALMEELSSGEFIEPEKKIIARDSVSGWSCVIENSLMKPWSKKDLNRTSKTTVASGGTKMNLTSPAAEALQILKNTFCNRDACVASSVEVLRQDYCADLDGGSNYDTSSNRSSNLNNKRSFSCTHQTYKAFSSTTRKDTKRIKQCSKGRCPETPKDSHCDGLKIIPISLL